MLVRMALVFRISWTPLTIALHPASVKPGQHNFGQNSQPLKCGRWSLLGKDDQPAQLALPDASFDARHAAVSGAANDPRSRINAPRFLTLLRFDSAGPACRLLPFVCQCVFGNLQIGGDPLFTRVVSLWYRFRCLAMVPVLAEKVTKKKPNKGWDLTRFYHGHGVYDVVSRLGIL